MSVLVQVRSVSKRQLELLREAVHDVSPCIVSLLDSSFPKD
jgi:hypothetical protein